MLHFSFFVSSPIFHSPDIISNGVNYEIGVERKKMHIAVSVADIWIDHDNITFYF